VAHVNRRRRRVGNAAGTSVGRHWALADQDLPPAPGRRCVPPIGRVRRAAGSGRRRPPIVAAVRGLRHRLDRHSPTPRRPTADAADQGALRDVLHRQILPTFGAAKLASIQPHQVRRWHAGIADQVSPLQAAKAYRLMRTVLNTAVRDGLLAVNPCNIEGGGRGAQRRAAAHRRGGGVRAGRGDRAEVPGAASADRLRARITQRRVRACRRRHVDLLHARIRTEIREQDGDNGPVASAPKNDSARWTSLPEFLVDEVTHHLDTYAQPGPDGDVFTSPKGGPIAPVHWYQSFRLARAAVGMPELHPHDLRHAAGIFLAQQGATTREIMARLGHRSRGAADRYQHAAARRDTELATRLSTAAEAARARSRKHAS